jgi:hypothetical protein
MSIKRNPAILRASETIGRTKADLKNAVTVLEATIAEGYMDAVDAIVIAKQLEEMAKLIRSSAVIYEQAEQEIANGRKDALGAKLSATTRSTYSYEDSPAWIALSEQIQIFTEARKAIEAQAKAVKHAVVDTETGELVCMPAKVVGGSKSISVTLAK